MLVIEDDPAIRKLLRKYLEQLDLVVLEAGNAKAALVLLEGEKPSLVCLDLVLPEASGLDICERIRATPGLAATPVVVISARSMPPDRARAEEVGANAYLVKPVRRQTFERVVKELLQLD
ncbi:MAG TPA: response regulator [Myxococcales bacterium]|nr:response regulator [Myxococcales bacterium]